MIDLLSETLSNVSFNFSEFFKNQNSEFSPIPETFFPPKTDVIRKNEQIKRNKMLFYLIYILYLLVTRLYKITLLLMLSFKLIHCPHQTQLLFLMTYKQSDNTRNWIVSSHGRCKNIMEIIFYLPDITLNV